MNSFKLSKLRSEHRLQLTCVGAASKPAQVELAPCRNSVMSILGISASLDKLLSLSQHTSRYRLLSQFPSCRTEPRGRGAACRRTRNSILTQVMGFHLAGPGTHPESGESSLKIRPSLLPQRRPPPIKQTSERQRPALHAGGHTRHRISPQPSCHSSPGGITLFFLPKHVRQLQFYSIRMSLKASVLPKALQIPPGASDSRRCYLVHNPMQFSIFFNSPNPL